MKTPFKPLYLVMMLMAFNLSSCGDDDKPIKDDEEEPTPQPPKEDKEDEPTTLDLSKVTINQEESHTYTSIFEVPFKEGNNDYILKIKTNIYDYDGLTVNQSIKANIETITLGIDKTAPAEVEIKSGDITISEKSEDKITLTFDKLTFTLKKLSRSTNSKNDEYIINGTITYNINQRSVPFSITQDVDPKDMVAEAHNVGSNNYDASFEMSYDGHKFYIYIKKENKDKINKGAILNNIIDNIYYDGNDYSIKKGNIVLYQTLEDTYQLFFDNVTIDSKGNEVSVNGLLDYKVIGETNIDLEPFTINKIIPQNSITKLYTETTNISFELWSDSDVLQLTISQMNKDKLQKGFVLNDVIEEIYHYNNLIHYYHFYKIKKGKIILYDISNESYSLFFDDVIIYYSYPHYDTEIELNGLLEYNFFKQDELSGTIDVKKINFAEIVNVDTDKYDTQFNAIYEGKEFNILIDKENRRLIRPQRSFTEYVKSISYNNNNYTIKEGYASIESRNEENYTVRFSSTIITNGKEDIEIIGTLAYKIVFAETFSLINKSKWDKKPPFKEFTIDGIAHKGQDFRRNGVHCSGFSEGYEVEPDRINFTLILEDHNSEDYKVRLDMRPNHNRDYYIEGNAVNCSQVVLSYPQFNNSIIQDSKAKLVGGAVYVYEQTKEYVAFYFENAVFESNLYYYHRTKMDGVLKFVKDGYWTTYPFGIWE